MDSVVVVVVVTWVMWWVVVVTWIVWWMKWWAQSGFCGGCDMCDCG